VKGGEAWIGHLGRQQTLKRRITPSWRDLMDKDIPIQNVRLGNIRVKMRGDSVFLANDRSKSGRGDMLLVNNW
jgi:hypothetical protein